MDGKLSPALFETRVLSSLSKVFADEDLSDSPVGSGTALWKEVYSFQVAYRSYKSIRGLTVRVNSPLTPYITLRAVGLAPSELPVFAETDANYLRTTPGLYPDPLYPASDGVLDALPGQWRSVWATIELPSLEEAAASGLNLKAGEALLIELEFTAPDGERLGGASHELIIIPAELPEQKLLYTNWFHCDCLATQYNVEIFSEQHWLLIERYMENAARHGMNMALTPLFTPPLDTAIGGERPTVQLVGVTLTDDGQYRFDFSLLERWIEMCDKVGIRYYEFSHLFTQWGARHAPKIIATTADGERRIFGWETDAGSEEYRQFLDAFLPELVRFIQAHGLEKVSYFHVSDEPGVDHMPAYRQASEMLRSHLSEFAFIEALSDYDFYESGLVPIPIPANNHIEPFLENGVDPLWTYYCCGQTVDVANRLFSMPSARNRVLGLQLYKFNIQGFLHWGYNFWYTQHSLRAIDPFRVTDSGCAFPSGDAFVVYPGEDGPLDSIRWEVFREGLQDLRALELLGSLRGKEATVALLEAEMKERLTFSKYPVSIEELLDIRHRVNQMIAESIG